MSRWADQAIRFILALYEWKEEKTMSDKQELRLKPCPFCGGEAKIFVPGDGGICVICTECKCQTPYKDDIYAFGGNFGWALYDVVDRWNTRQNGEGEDNETDITNED